MIEHIELAVATVEQKQLSVVEEFVASKPYYSMLGGVHPHVVCSLCKVIVNAHSHKRLKYVLQHEISQRHRSRMLDATGIAGTFHFSK